MERSEVIDAMGKLRLYGMRAAYDEVLTTAVKRQHEPQQIIGDLLTAEIAEAMKARGPKPGVTVYDDCGHAPTLTRPADTEWIAGLLETLVETSAADT